MYFDNEHPYHGLDVYLIQRLQKPFPANAGGLKNLVNAFSFGGGLVNGGLSKDAMSLLSSICRFDYMGSAEFEWGAVPKTLKQIASFATAGELIASEIDVEGFVYDGWQKTQKKTKRKFYILAPKTLTISSWSKSTASTVSGKEFVSLIISYLASGDHKGKKYPFLKGSLKESPMIHSAFNEKFDKEDELRKTVGWLELDNHYMFFSDKTMFEQMATLFGVNTGPEVPVPAPAKQ